MVIISPDRSTYNPVDGEMKKIAFGTQSMHDGKINLTIACYEPGVTLDNSELMEEIAAVEGVYSVWPMTENLIEVDLFPDTTELVAVTLGKIIASHAGWKCYDDNLNIV